MSNLFYRNPRLLVLTVSLILVAAAVALLVVVIRRGDLEHGDRLSLLPLQDDLPSSPESAAPAAKTRS